MSTTQTLEFQAETRHLLQLVIHSVYSNKDVFLRELISNASDALDKLRMEAFRDKDLQVDTDDPHIGVTIDAQARTLTVRDNGIGMNRDEVVALIGTIAKSGTSELLRQWKEAAESSAPDLIGQFGVGFYATFMVADKVTLVTRRAGESQATRWESDGQGTYTIEDLDDAPQGTSVTLHLKAVDEQDGLFDYADDRKIREIVKRYSDFVSWPVRLDVQRETAEGETVHEVDTLNSQTALWARPKGEVTKEEYDEFYKSIAHDWSDPLETITMKGEGTFEYEALLFIPSHAPHDLFMRDGRTGIRLYVKRVMIMDECDVLPEYLRFVKGIVDARDLSLNVSREILQQDRQIQLVRRRLTRKVLGTINSMLAADDGRYTTFWREFGRALKEGLLSDVDNRQEILEVISVASTRDPLQTTTLRGYIERMQEGQQEIYYMTGTSRALVEKSPHLEAFRDKGLEVLLLTDPVDEVWTDSISEFDGHKLQSIAKGQVDLGSGDSEDDAKPSREEFGDLLSWMGSVLTEQVKEVRLSQRLTTSPACIVGDDFDMSRTLEQMYRAMGQELPPTKRILEVNADHPLLVGLRKAYDEGGERESLSETVELLYDIAVLAEGGEVKDPAKFTTMIANRLALSL
ncbi:molecular chaperone HtpG [Allocatelliglobosispora scoriae]|uniref:Chaperone protein HtpG n=1 Tax=Allocatelliglobosispora scoriae TaxID=643052 RepID=A0A841BUI7_9ACTN|nr:molecular chaperone HtpG [Allocatelliglobosispora scoriae]MBB5872777.1 molecular chaperone HtpG [Allocatelliglobosispora scoriae]